jgi:transcription elongation factor Elf1
MITKDSIYCPRCGQEVYISELANDGEIVITNIEHIIDCWRCGLIDTSVTLTEVCLEPDPYGDEDDYVIKSYWAETKMHWEEETLHD